MSSVALDIGGTYIKAARIRRGNVMGAVIRRPIPDFVEAGFGAGAREINAEQLDSAVFDVLAELGIDQPHGHDIFISGQMAGVAFVDDDGQAVRNIVSWQDTRFRNIEAIKRGLTKEQLMNLGDGLRVGSPAVTLSEVGVPEGSFPTSLIAYVVGRLAGSRATRVHATDAAAWGLFDTRNMRWSRAACAAAGVDMEVLPTVSLNLEPASDHARVFTGVGDQQAALLGAGVSNKQVSVNLATGGQVSIVAETFGERAQTRPYFEDQYLHTVTHLPAGRLLTAALSASRGETDVSDWESAWTQYEGLSPFLEAVGAIAEGIRAAVETLEAWGRDVLFSGGLVQRSGPLVSRVLLELGSPRYEVFRGSDASLSGLAILGAGLARKPD